MIFSRFFVALLVLFLITGCVAFHYAPTTPYIPLNEKKGELKANISYNTYQIGYSFSDMFSVFTTGYQRVHSYHHIMQKENSGSGFGGDSFYDFSLGLSCFKAYGLFRFEMIGAFGNGSMNYHHGKDLHYYQFNIDSKVNRLYLQPDLGLKINDYLEFSVFSKMSACRYYDMDVKADLNSGRLLDSDDLYFIGKKTLDLYFIEPGILCRVGFKKFKFEFSALNVYSLNNDNIKYKPIHLNISIFLNFDLLKQLN